MNLLLQGSWMYIVDALLLISVLTTVDWRKIFVSKSRAWIVEEFVPEGVDDVRSARTRSRYAEWNSRRKAKRATHKYHSHFGPLRAALEKTQGDEKTCIYCGQEEPYSEGRASPESLCPKAPIRAAHWAIVRLSGDRWEDVRKRDRMVLEAAMKAIRTHMSQRPKSTYRLRNLHTNDIIMGDILRSGIVQPGGNQEQSASDVFFGAFQGGVSHSKN